MFAVQGLRVLVAFQTIRVSLRGTPLDTERRSSPRPCAPLNAAVPLPNETPPDLSRLRPFDNHHTVLIFLVFFRGNV